MRNTHPIDKKISKRYVHCITSTNTLNHLKLNLPIFNSRLSLSHQLFPFILLILQHLYYQAIHTPE